MSNKAKIIERTVSTEIPNNPNILMQWIDNLQGTVLKDNEGKPIGQIHSTVTVLPPLPAGPKGLVVIAVVRIAVASPLGDLVLPE